MPDMNVQEVEAPRLLDEDTVMDAIERVKALRSPEDGLSMSVQSWWRGSQRWARNRASMTSDQRDLLVAIRLQVRGGVGSGRTNQITFDSLEAAVKYVTHFAEKGASNSGGTMELGSPNFTSKGINVWSDRTFNRTPEDNGKVVHALTERARSQGLMSAGYIETVGANVWTYARDIYGRESLRKGLMTQAQCSVTVRHPKGTGSGWAGNSSFELDRVDMSAISETALDKCLRSLNPVRIEPGRYQCILEPEAVATLASLLYGMLHIRELHERGIKTPLMLGYDSAVQRVRSKIGLKIVDDRINLYHDPEDPLSGTHWESGVDKVDVIRSGILTSMLHGYTYAQRELYKEHYDAPRTSFVLSGGNTSIEEMVSATKRGLLVSRLTSPEKAHGASALYRGLTRDGLWLIENGKITQAVKNFRWTESPLFAFNNVVDIGPSVPVFSPGNHGRFPFSEGWYHNAVTSVVVPAMRVNDFSFTSTTDAI